MMNSPSRSEAHGDEPSAVDHELARHRHYIAQAAEVCAAAARGDLEARILDIDGDDDLARMLLAINHMLDLTDAFVREAGAALTYASAGKFFRRVLVRGLHGSFRQGAEVINKATCRMAESDGALARAATERRQLADDFESAIKGAVDILASAVTELQATAETLNEGATQTSELATSTSVAVERAADNVRNIATAAERLVESALAAGERVAASASSAQNAATQAAQTNDTVATLTTASTRIGRVVDVIAKVAGQTNLLALNATIEAARAGEAGKGFSVVASEVKLLANQTKIATEEIDEQVEGIRSATGDVVTAIRDITSTIDAIAENSRAVSSAMEEQRTVATDIGTSSHLAAAGTVEASKSVAGVTAATRRTGHATVELVAAATDLARLAESLRSDVDGFLAGIRG